MPTLQVKKRQNYPKSEISKLTSAFKIFNKNFPIHSSFKSFKFHHLAKYYSFSFKFMVSLKFTPCSNSFKSANIQTNVHQCKGRLHDFFRPKNSSTGKGGRKEVRGTPRPVCSRLDSLLLLRGTLKKRKRNQLGINSLYYANISSLVLHQTC